MTSTPASRIQFDPDPDTLPGAAPANPADQPLPPVRILLAVLLWLSARLRENPTPATLRALARHTERLVIHPDATAADVAGGLRLVGAAHHDALLWLTTCVDVGHDAVH